MACVHRITISISLARRLAVDPIAPKGQQGARQWEGAIVAEALALLPEGGDAVALPVLAVPKVRALRGQERREQILFWERWGITLVAAEQSI